jgi:hypothetical protein
MDSSLLINIRSLACFPHQNVTQHHDNSPESRLLTIGIQCIERYGDFSVSNDFRDWMISSLEVDIDMEEELGSVGFGVVRKGMWNGLAVVVNKMMPDTCHEVIRPLIPVSYI